MYKLLLFAGTTEGRELAEYFSTCNVQVTVCVATEYGQTLILQRENLSVCAGRLTQQEMEEKIIGEGYDLVVDATHPYAQVVTENIRSACEKTGRPYFRCLRQEESAEGYANVLFAEDTSQAAQMLEEIEGNILLTTGSKELCQYQKVSGFTERFYPRVLPLANVVESCLALGIPAGHLIAMQGPFSEELNLAMIRQWNIRCLVTKESGKAGGFDEKLNAAKKAGILTLVIGRPKEQSEHDTVQGIREKFQQQYKIAPIEKQKNRRYFPMFVSLDGKSVQVIGGGTIATRRIKTLLRFGCRIRVIAPELCEDCRKLWEDRMIDWEERVWHQGDCTGELVLAATDSPKVNEQIVQECRQKKITVNRCDKQQDCDFYFPAVVEHDGLVFGLCSGGADHKKVKDAAAALRKSFRDDAAME